MKIFRSVLTLFLALAGTVTMAQNQADVVMWYDKPANNWLEALPLGNSTLGAMVYGGVEKEEIQLNEETFWAGSPHDNDNPEALAHLDEVRQLIFAGRNKEAEELCNKYFFTGKNGMAFLTLGSLNMEFKNASGPVSGYRRELDLSKALSTTSYTVGGVKFTRTAFAAMGEDVIVVNMKADQAEAINATLSMSTPVKVAKVSTEKGTDGSAYLVQESAGPDQEGVPGKLIAHSVVKVSANGSVSTSDQTVTVSGASEMTLLITAGTNFKKYDDISGDGYAKAKAALAKAEGKSVAQLYSAHYARYSKQFDKVSFNLPKGENSGLVTSDRVVAFGEGKDASFATLLFQYGRYLLISSSQNGGQAANLQGVWNNSPAAPWDGKYTININAEMNYWPAEVTNLSETHNPLFSLIRDLSVTGARTAKVMYGSKGWVAHHNTDIWREAGPVDFAAAGMWPSGGAWLTQHLWQHYLYTGDKEFLAANYDILKGCAEFYLDFLTEDPRNGYLVVSPSYSPEHGDITAGCTMDNQLLFDVFSNAEKASEILGVDADFRAKVVAARAKLAPMRVGQHGQLQEWLEDIDDPNDQHRHVSHLYGLYPSNQVSPYTHPELFQAAKATLNQRGDEATGWSIGWKINLWARLLDGNHAFRIISNMIKIIPGEQGFGARSNGKLYPNLFDAHPPFQIDGNFGYTAGVAEMIMQSHDGAIHLLPAIPDEWAQGSMKGLVARGGFVVDMDWSEGAVDAVKIHSNIGGVARIRSAVPLKGKGLKPAEGSCPNPLLEGAEIADPICKIAVNAQPQTVYEYDLKTVKGKNYKIVRK